MVMSICKKLRKCEKNSSVMSKKSDSLGKAISGGGLIEVVLLGTYILTITGFFGKFGWILDLTSNFRVQYAVIQLLCLLFLLLIKRWKSVVVALLFATINMTQIVPWYINDSRLTDAGTTVVGKVKILLINVSTSNTDHDKTMEYIKRMNPDLLALEEINDRWLSDLSPVLASFSSKEVLTREDNFGIGLFGKIPFQNSKVEYFGKARVPSIISKICIAERPVTILFTHPLPPGSVDYFHLRNEQLEEIASSRKDFGDSLIVMGDLNTTSWSYYYKRFVSRMKLHDSRKGFGIHASWPAMLPIMLIPIDHCLISGDIIVLDRKVGHNLGSDHYPVYIELELLD